MYWNTFGGNIKESTIVQRSFTYSWETYTGGLGEGLFGQVLCEPGQNQDLDCGQAEQIQAVSK